MNKKLVALFSFTILLILPIIVFAIVIPPAPVLGSAGDPIDIINKILNFIWPLFIGAAIISLIVAGFLFLTAQGDPTKLQIAKQGLLWGIVGIVVALLAFSIPFIIQNSLTSPAP